MVAISFGLRHVSRTPDRRVPRRCSEAPRARRERGDQQRPRWRCFAGHRRAPQEGPFFRTAVQVVLTLRLLRRSRTPVTVTLAIAYIERTGLATQQKGTQLFSCELTCARTRGCHDVLASVRPEPVFTCLTARWRDWRCSRSKRTMKLSSESCPKRLLGSRCHFSLIA